MFVRPTRSPSTLGSGAAIRWAARHTEPRIHVREAVGVPGAHQALAVRRVRQPDPLDVARTRRTVEYWRIDLAGDHVVEEDEVRGETVGSVTCRWCGRSDAIEVAPRPAVADHAVSGPKPAEAWTCRASRRAEPDSGPARSPTAAWRSCPRRSARVVALAADVLPAVAGLRRLRRVAGSRPTGGRGWGASRSPSSDRRRVAGAGGRPGRRAAGGGDGDRAEGAARAWLSATRAGRRAGARSRGLGSRRRAGRAVPVCELDPAARPDQGRSSAARRPHKARAQVEHLKAENARCAASRGSRARRAPGARDRRGGAAARRAGPGTGGLASLARTRSFVGYAPLEQLESEQAAQRRPAYHPGRPGRGDPAGAAAARRRARGRAGLRRELALPRWPACPPTGWRPGSP